MWYKGVEWPEMMINNEERYIIDRFQTHIFDSIVMIKYYYQIGLKNTCCQPKTKWIGTNGL